MKILTVLSLTLVLLSGIAWGQSDTEDISLDITSRALSLKGTPYVYGGVTPAGFDCSGFVWYVFRDNFPEIPRSMAGQIDFSRPVDRAELQPGDLVFFATISGQSGPSHVAIYLGHDTVIHAMSRGKDVGVNLSTLDESYWKTRILFYRRILPDSKVSEASQDTAPPSDREETGVSDEKGSATGNDQKKKDTPGSFDSWRSMDSVEFQDWLKSH